MIDFILYQIPWWAYGIAAAVIIGTLYSTIGLRNTLYAIGAALLFIFHVRSRQQGWTDRETKGQHDAEKIIVRAGDARRDADVRNTDAGGLRNDDGHKRD